MAYDILLSQKDKYTPLTHVPIYNILNSNNFLLRDAKLNIFKENEENIRKLRTSTFKDVKKEFDKTGTFDYAAYFNVHNIEIRDLGMNHFQRNKGLGPICHLIECFQTVVETPKYKKVDGKSKKIGTEPRKYISFGIKKEYFAEYLLNIEADNEDFVPRKQTKQGSKFNKNMLIVNKWYIQMETSQGLQHAKGKKTPTFERFCIWCQNKGIKKQNGLEMALELLLETYPVDNLPTDAEILSKRMSAVDYVEVDTKDFDFKVYENGKVRRMIEMDPENLKIMLRILKTYNRSVESEKTGKLSLSSLMAMSFRTFCSVKKDFIIKYATPEKYKELMELKKMKEYNENVDSTK